MSRFSERLKELRLKSGMTQLELAMRIGVSKSSINMYERGEREPGLETVERIADCFGVNLDYLCGRDARCSAGSELLDERIERIKKVLDDIDAGRAPGYGYVIGFGGKGEAISKISEQKFQKIQAILALIDEGKKR